MEMTTNMTYRTHRVGSVTTGLCLIVFGILLLLHSLFDIIGYQTILSFWPVILIGLGLELLLSTIFQKTVVYDKGAVFLMILMAFFAIGMAVTEVCIEMTELYISNGIY